MNVKPLRKDVVIIGGGIAGLTAAMYTSMMALDSLVIQKTPFIGQISESSQRKNYPGLRNISGGELAQNIEEQVKQDFSIEIKREEALDIVHNSTVPYRFLVKTDYGNYLSKSVILATGSSPKDMDVENTNITGISYYPMYDASEFEDKDVVIVGIRDASVQFASWLLPLAQSVTLVEKKADPKVSPMNLRDLEALHEHNNEKINVLWEHSIRSLIGTDHVEGVILRNELSGEELSRSAGAVIMCSGRKPNSDLASKVGCELDRNGFVIVDREQKTTVPGMFAAGDVAGVVFSAIKSAGEGCVAGWKTADFLNSSMW